MIFSVVSVKKAIESLLDNDLDMADLYLSQGNPTTQLLISKWFKIIQNLKHDCYSLKRSTEARWSTFSMNKTPKQNNINVQINNDVHSIVS